MRMISAANDGTTTIEFTAAEGRALRNVLRDLTGSPTAHQLQRLQAMIHGEASGREPERPSADHQAIYLDSHDQVWCDYPTVPAGDDVLPLVWASEVAQSRSDLEADGNKLRVIGWCK